MISHELFDRISEEAEKRFWKYQRAPGARGQQVTEKDDPEYWYASVAYEMGLAGVRKE